MIDIVHETYYREKDVTEIHVRYKFESRSIQYSFFRDGKLTEQEIEQEAQNDFEDWKQRTA